MLTPFAKELLPGLQHWQVGGTKSHMGSLGTWNRVPCSEKTGLRKDLTIVYGDLIGFYGILWDLMVIRKDLIGYDWLMVI